MRANLVQYQDTPERQIRLRTSEENDSTGTEENVGHKQPNIINPANPGDRMGLPDRAIIIGKLSFQVRMAERRYKGKQKEKREPRTPLVRTARHRMLDG
jgi:hypothetical protein